LKNLPRTYGSGERTPRPDATRPVARAAIVTSEG
jgi:hypothetical protein